MFELSPQDLQLASHLRKCAWYEHDTSAHRRMKTCEYTYNELPLLAFKKCLRETIVNTIVWGVQFVWPWNSNFPYFFNPVRASSIKLKSQYTIPHLGRPLQRNAKSMNVFFCSMIRWLGCPTHPLLVIVIPSFSPSSKKYLTCPLWR